MANMTVIKRWYDEIKDRVETIDPYFYVECGTEKVEFDVDEKDFIKVSKELGWM